MLTSGHYICINEIRTTVNNTFTTTVSGICTNAIYSNCSAGASYNLMDYGYIASWEGDYDYDYDHLRWCNRFQSIRITDFDYPMPAEHVTQASICM